MPPNETRYICKETCELEPFTGTYSTSTADVKVKAGLRCPAHGTVYTLTGLLESVPTHDYIICRGLMVSNGKLHGRRTAILNPDHWVERDWKPPAWKGRRELQSERKWIDLGSPPVVEYLRGGGWNVESTTRTWHPPDGMEEAFENRIAGLAPSMEHYRVLFRRGRKGKAANQKHKRAQAVMLAVSALGYADQDIARFLDINEKTIRRARTSAKRKMEETGERHSASL